MDITPGVIQMKAIFGSRATANLAASQFYLATGYDAKAGHEGESLIWTVMITMPDSEVCW